MFIVHATRESSSQPIREEKESFEREWFQDKVKQAGRHKIVVCVSTRCRAFNQKPADTDQTCLAPKAQKHTQKTFSSYFALCILTTEEGSEGAITQQQTNRYSVLQIMP